MPIYEYSCPRCGRFEQLQPSSAKALARCPTCRSKVTKLISASSFHLKGGGWYADGYQRPAGSAGAKTASKPEEKSSPKPAPAKAESSKTDPKSSSSK